MTTEQQTTAEHDQTEELEDLKTKLTIAEAEAAELRPVKIRETLRAAGFDPDSGNGRALADLIADDTGLHRSPAKVRELAAKYGWEPMDPADIPNRPANTPETNIDEQIRQAEEAEDFLTAGRLKLQKHQERQQAAAPTPDPARRQAIAEAEEAEDWAKAGRLKIGALADRTEDLPEAPAPSDLDAQIAEAEEAGDWTKAGMLKLQRMGGA